ncbi:MAG: cryptochrome/photolyase family protein [Akkermansiaceae bacterium]
MSNTPSIVWFRRDLRLNDNPAWNAAIQSGSPIIPLYIHCPEEEGKWPRGGASNWFLHHALTDLDQQLQAHGSRLIIKKGKSLAVLQKIITETEANSAFWNRCYEPAAVERDKKVKQTLISDGVHTESFNGSLLLDPLVIKNKSGKPFQVYTPFWKHCVEFVISTPHTEKASKQLATPDIQSDGVDELNLLPSIPWDEGLKEFWNPTRAGALALLEKAATKAARYSSQRDSPAVDGTSLLSSYLHFGQISPHEFYDYVRNNSDTKKADSGIIRQLYWREFSAHLLYHFPHSQDTALKPQYDSFPWEFNETQLRAWQLGKTGFPIVDAGMRQLYTTGWMHNRVRMITGSLLVKHLLIPWQEGARWFWDTLTDADLANNSMGWQWVAGSGADASPYFRIFNPIIQGKKFDPKGEYVKTWCPELKELGAEHIHTPWEATPMELNLAGITLGENYPHPIVSHEEGRKRALDAYQTFKES